MPEQNGSKLSTLQIALAVAAWIGGMGVQWGIAKASQSDIERRVSTLEQEVRDDVVPRREYETWQKDIRDRLDTIENKLDRNQRQGGKLE